MICFHEKRYSGAHTKKLPSPASLFLCIVYCVWQEALKAPEQAVFTRLRLCTALWGLYLCTHCLVCASFIGTDLLPIYLSSITLWRNFPYVECATPVFLVCRKEKWIERVVIAALFSHKLSLWDITCEQWVDTMWQTKTQVKLYRNLNRAIPLGSFCVHPHAEVESLEMWEKENGLEFCRAVPLSIPLWKTWLVFVRNSLCICYCSSVLWLSFFFFISHNSFKT